MKVVTAEEMREIDRVAIDEYQIPATVLMALAGNAVAEHIAARYSPESTITIICGTGNNGGDGFVTAWLLSQRGFSRIALYLHGKEKSATDSTSHYLSLCHDLAIPFIADIPSLKTRLMDTEVLVDALFGTGFNGPPRGDAVEIIEIMRNVTGETVAIDMPSGLPSNETSFHWPAVPARHTITMGLPKPGQITGKGRDYCGTLHVANIGFPRAVIEATDSHISLPDRDTYGSSLSACLSKGESIHKNMRGQLLIVGGFPGMEGAALLSARGAFAAGIGIVTVATHPESRGIIAGHIPELMTATLSDVNSLTSVLSSRSYNAAVLGSGMGRSERAGEIFSAFCQALPESSIAMLVIDGDGLYHLSQRKKPLPWEGTLILTPHEGEAATLLSISTEEVSQNRYTAAREISKQYNATTILKGPGTLVTDGTDTIVIQYGNSLLATAGSGDILAGITGAFASRNSAAFDVAVSAVAVHGLAADICREERNPHSIRSGDIIPYIDSAIGSIMKA